MKNQFMTVGIFIIASAVIWGVVIVGCSMALRGTECYDSIRNILTGGVISHIILIWGPLALLFRKQKEQADSK